MAKKSVFDYASFKVADLPSSPDPAWVPVLQPRIPEGLSWFLVDAEGERRAYLSHKNRHLMWNKQPCRTQQEGKDRNAIILEKAQQLLNPDEPMTLRHLFYLLVTDGVIDNCPADYSIVSIVTTEAREADEIDDASITDGHRTVVSHYGYDSVREYASVAPCHYTKNLWPSQDSYVECWFEKAAIMSVVGRLQTRYQVTMRPFKGHASRTYCADIARDFSKIEKPITVYYCGDHDPSGYAIPRSGEKRVKDILWSDHDGGNADFQVVRLGFNPEHFEQHNLESWDVDRKKKDSNYQWFVDNFGEKCAEIDAIPPDELRTMLEYAILSHINDPEAWDTLRESQDSEREAIELALSGF